MPTTLGWADRKRIQRVAHLLRYESHGDTHHYASVIRHMGMLLPGTQQLVFDLDPADQLSNVMHNLNQGGSTWDTVRNWNWLQKNRAYNAMVRGPDANVPTNTYAAVAAGKLTVQEYREQLVTPNGVWSTLRTALWAGDTFAGVVVACKQRSDGEDFGPREAALVKGVVPLLVDGMVATKILGRASRDVGTVQRLMDAYPAAAFVVSTRGAVTYANPRAVAQHPTIPAWLRQVGRQDGWRPAGTRLVRFECDGGAQYLVMPPPPARPSPHLASLPPHLQRVAQLVALGCADKEVAARLDLSVATVRTYVTRIFAALRVHNRVELAGLLSRPR